MMKKIVLVASLLGSFAVHASPLVNTAPKCQIVLTISKIEAEKRVVLLAKAIQDSLHKKNEQEKLSFQHSTTEINQLVTAFPDLIHLYMETLSQYRSSEEAQKRKKAHEEREKIIEHKPDILSTHLLNLQGDAPNSSKQHLLVQLKNGEFRVKSLIEQEDFALNDFVQKNMKDVKKIYTFDTLKAFGFLTNSGTFMTYGRSYHHKNLPEMNIPNVKSVVYAKKGAAAILLNDGRVVVWGDPIYLGKASQMQNQLAGVVSIHANDGAFVALKRDGTIVTFGNQYFAAELPTDFNQKRNGARVVQVFNTSRAFTVLLDNGKIMSWGEAEHGGDSSAISSQIEANQKVINIVGGEHAFTLLLDNGKIFNWGDNLYGGEIPANLKNILNNKKIVSIVASQWASLAMDQNGQYYSWGADSTGGYFTKNIPEHQQNGYSIHGFENGFVAIQKDGSVLIDAGQGFKELPANTVDPVGIKVFANNAGVITLESDGRMQFFTEVKDWQPTTLKSEMNDIIDVSVYPSSFLAIKKDGRSIVVGETILDYDNQVINLDLY